MPSDAKVKGPASYFPSIEKAYGKPVAYWFEVLDALHDRKHMEQVAVLKSDYGVGHGHANALVAYHRARSAGCGEGRRRTVGPADAAAPAGRWLGPAHGRCTGGRFGG